MTHREFQPKKLRKGDYLSIALHSDWIIRVINVQEDRIAVTGMPHPLMYGEYWPVELTQEMLKKNNAQEIFDIYKEEKELKYVHQFQHLLQDKSIKLKFEL